MVLTDIHDGIVVRYSNMVILSDDVRTKELIVDPTELEK
jgi:hypothetical protein